MTYEQIAKDIKNKIFKPVYFLHGEEPYYIDKLSEIIEQQVLDESEKEFNQSIIYGRDTDLPTVVGTAKRFPMMSNYQVVIIREAQEIKNFLPKDRKEGPDSGESDKKEDPAKSMLNAYLEKPLESTILVFCCKYRKLPKNSKIYKLIDKHGVVYESEKLYDNKIAAWIEKYLSEKSFRINPRAGILLTEYLGNDLSKIVNELDKLILNIRQGEEINTAHVEKFIGISKDYNVFELHKAIGMKDQAKAFKIVQYLGSNKKENPLVMTMASLYGYFAKLIKIHSLEDKSPKNILTATGVNPFFQGEYLTALKHYSFPKLVTIIGLISEFDLKSKGVNSVSAEEGELLQELVYKIFQAA